MRGETEKVNRLLPNIPMSNITEIRRGCPRSEMVKVKDCGIVVNESELQAWYNVHFRTNSLGKGMNPLILPVMG